MQAAPDRLTEMLTRLKLTAARDQLDGLLDEAGREELSLRATLVLLCEREIAHKDERRIEMTRRWRASFRARPHWLRLRSTALDRPRTSARASPARVASPMTRTCCCSRRLALARPTLRWRWSSPAFGAVRRRWIGRFGAWRVIRNVMADPLPPSFILR
jgi:hypothetical protein